MSAERDRGVSKSFPAKWSSSSEEERGEDARVRRALSPMKAHLFKQRYSKEKAEEEEDARRPVASAMRDASEKYITPVTSSKRRAGRVSRRGARALSVKHMQLWRRNESSCGKGEDGENLEEQLEEQLDESQSASKSTKKPSVR